MEEQSNPKKNIDNNTVKNTAKNTIEKDSEKTKESITETATTSKAATSDKNTEKAKTELSVSPRKSTFFSGIFWIITGCSVLVYNFLPNELVIGEEIVLRSMFQMWAMPVLGVYLVVFSLLRWMKRPYFILGVLLLALFIGQVIIQFNPGTDSNMQKLVWPIVMLVISVSIIVYGTLFKRSNRRMASYLVVGAILILFSLVVFFSVLNTFTLSVFLKKLWPVFLVFLGLSYIQRALLKSGKKQKKDIT